MKKLILIILIVLTPNLANAQWEQMGGNLNGKEKFDYFGRNSEMSGDGNTIAISSTPLYEENNVRVYKYLNNQWNQVGEDILLDDQGLYYSYSLSLNENGSTLAIGNSIYNSKYNSDTGFVKVFQLESNQWVQKGETLKNSEKRTVFGATVSLSSNGDMIAIEAKGKEEDPLSFGFVEIFNFTQNGWVQIGERIISENPGLTVGNMVKLSSDGKIVTFGVPLGDIDGNYKSRIKVFKFSNQAWEQLGKDIDGVINNTNSPAKLDLNADGTTLIIGEPSSTVGKKVEFTGDVNVYKYSFEDWYQIGQNIYGESSYLAVGRSTSISADGTIIAICTPNYIGNYGPTGKVDMYKLTANRWEQLGSSLVGEHGEDFGVSLDLSSDGLTVLIGAPRNDSNGTSSGQVRIFRYNPKTSVYESADDESILVYPNPTKGEVIIQFTEHTLSSEISIIDATGKQVSSTEITDQISRIDLSDLTIGVYYIHIKNSNGTKIKKIIKE